jgi:hypothetical protein
MFKGNLHRTIEDLAVKLLLEEGQSKDQDFSPKFSEKSLIKIAEMTFILIAKTKVFNKF